MTLDNVKPLIDWLQANPNLAGFVIGLISLAESLAVVGSLIPGTLVMTAIGTLLGAGILPLWEVMAWAIAGAIVGDGASYWLGYHFHEHIREMWPFRSYPLLMKKGEAFFLAHGGKSVFLGRFIGPIRPIIPVVAGMMNMPPLRFTVANVLSALGWAPAYMGPGILLGAVSLQIAPQTAGRFLVIVIIAALGLWCAYWFIKRIFSWLARRISLRINQLWQFIQRTPSLSFIKRALQEHERPEQHHALSLAVFCVLSLLCVFLIFLDVYYKHHFTLDLNDTVLHLFRSLRDAHVDKIAICIAFISSTPVLSSVFIVTLAWLLLKKCWRAASHWFQNILLVTLITTGLKFLARVPYPTGLVLHFSGWAFPSSSVALSTALFGYLAVLSDHQWPNHRRLIFSSTAFLIALIAFAQVYLGLHWLSDVTAGLFLGIASVLFTTLLYRKGEITPLKPGHVLLVALSTLLIAWGVYGVKYYDRALQQYTLYWPSQTLEHNEWWTRPQIVGISPDRLKKINSIPNIQWASSLDSIEQKLVARGWQKIPKANLVVILNRIAAKDRTRQLPLLPKFYLDRKPVLIMTKLLEQPERLLILRVWDSHVTLEDPNSPLWLGAVDEHQPWQPMLLDRKKMNNSVSVPSSLEILKSDLKNFRWKEATSIVPCSTKAKTENCSIQLLLIRDRI